ncbi:hypothetical protein [Aliagarivorans taiwanensis]|uniref:hypothetical protein n=1 Tax=Aliagarivorans taiwanensis TaxID=561966 RepID=UPI0012FB8C6B|nr:hypothetical protein [Aliagarivorans taiwanensis]
MFADNRFREVVLRFKGNDHNLVRWSEIYDDAGKRFGIAFLADTRLKSIIATPADEFRYPGVHYVQSTVAEHAARFQWQYWLGQSTIAAGEHDLALKRGEQQALLAQQARNAAVVAEHKAELYAKYRSEYERLQAEHAARSEELDASFRLNKQRQMELELAISVNETSSAQQRRNSEDLVAQRERVIVQGELLEQQKLELEREHRETLEAALADTRNQQAELALAREQLAQQIVRYYPDFDRKMQASGVDVETAVRGYLDEQWNYNLAFDNSLLAANQRGALRFEYDLYFSGSKLEVDVSKIACAITRDHDGILAMAQIQPDTRLVYMQLHRASQENRSKAIAQCY